MSRVLSTFRRSQSTFSCSTPTCRSAAPSSSGSARIFLMGHSFSSMTRVLATGLSSWCLEVDRGQESASDQVTDSIEDTPVARTRVMEENECPIKKIRAEPLELGAADRQVGVEQEKVDWLRRNVLKTRDIQHLDHVAEAALRHVLSRYGVTLAVDFKRD